LLWLEVLLPKRLEEEFASALSLLVGWSLFVVRLSLLLLQVAKAVSDHMLMLMLSNLGGAGRRRQGLTLSDESTG
jgi:hypothetical protein